MAPTATVNRAGHGTRGDDDEACMADGSVALGTASQGLAPSGAHDGERPRRIQGDVPLTSRRAAALLAGRRTA